MRKSLALFGALCLAICTIFGTESWISYQQRLKEIEVANANFALTFEQYAIGILNKVDLSIRNVQQQMEFQETYRKIPIDDLIELLCGAAAQVPEVEVFGVVNAEGLVIATSRYQPHSENKRIGIEDRPYFIQQKSDPNAGLVIAGPQLSRTTQHPVLNFSRRINDHKGNFAGLVFMSVQLEVWSEFFSKTSPGEGEAISLFDRHRHLLARYPLAKSFQIGSYIPAPPALQKLMDAGLKSGTYIEISAIDRVRRVFSFRSLEKFPFSIIVSKSMNVILRNWKKNFLITIAMIFGLMFASIVFLIRSIRKSELMEEQRAMMMSSSKLSALGEMAAGIAHEINNPMTVIAGNSEQIVRMLDATPLDGEKIRARALKIHSTVDRVTKIIRGLKNFSRDGEKDPKEKVELSKIVSDVLDLSGERFKNSGIELRLDIPERLWVNCRSAQISQVLLNLLNNAYDATQGMNPRWIQLKAMVLDGDLIELRVIDCGSGIPSHIQEKIMIPFFTTKEIGKGTGLGLSISKGIIEEHGGQIRIDNNHPNTCFVITLPLFKNFKNSTS